MADINKIIDHVFVLEGGWVDHPSDSAGCTQMGITRASLSSYRGKTVTCSDVRNVSKAEATNIYKKNYWDKIKGDDINSQNVANLLFDFAVNSGVNKASKSIQELVGVSQDGIIGSKTIEAINKQDAEELFNRLKQYRRSYYDAIVRNNPSQKAFIRGWTNRLNSFKFECDC